MPNPTEKSTQNCKFMILMWKHSIVRWHRPISTFIEFTSTIIVFLLIYWKSDIFKVIEKENTAKIIPRSIPLKSIKAPSNVVFTRYDEDINPLMDKVAKELNLPKLGNFELGFPINKLNSTQVLVLFKNEDNFPYQLEYEIRVREFHPYDQNIPSNAKYIDKDKDKDGEVTEPEIYMEYKPFLRLQWAIDKSYIETLSGEVIKQNVVISMFPYKAKNYNFDDLIDLVSFANFIGLFLPFVFTMSRLVEERGSGVVELIRMAGVSKLTVIVSHFFNCLPAGIVYSLGGTFCLKFDASGGFLPNSDAFLIFLMLLLYYCSIIIWAMLSSFITSRKEFGAPIAILFYVVLGFRSGYLSNTNLFYCVRIVLGLLPHVPIHYFLWELQALESNNNGVTLDTMYERHGIISLSVLQCYLLFLLQILIVSLLVAYCTFVFPGKYGYPKPWDFLWKAPPEPSDFLEEEKHVSKNPQYFELPHRDKKVAVRVKNITKAYGEVIVLRNVSFDIYKGEITVLLGQNGAGKTTLMNVISGMIRPTYGEIEVNGVLSTYGFVHKDIGLCPQVNIFLQSLTVMQHVVFFARLKGQSVKQARKSSMALLEKLGLDKKANARSSKLSGGMKRRLQLACALSGGTRILVLDEPSTGLDVETRRDLWDCLASLRQSHTVLLSTHFMDEADALGDRVAALLQGELAVYATPFVLKSNMGTGYLITISSDGNLNQSKVANVITDHIPEVKLVKTNPHSVTYNIPLEASSQFPELFSVLENYRSKLGISTISLGMSTLEEVFNKLCRTVDKQPLAEEDIKERFTEATRFNSTRPTSLYVRQVCALWKRQILFHRSTFSVFIVFQLLMPTWYFFASTIFLNDVNITMPQQNETANFISNLNAMQSPRIFLDINSTKAFKKLTKTNFYPKLVSSKDILSDMKVLAENSIDQYDSLVAGLKINSTTIQVFHKAEKFSKSQAACVALNLASNIMLRMLKPRNRKYRKEYNITTTVRDKGQTESQDVAVLRSRMNDKIIEMSFWMLFVLTVFYATIMNVGILIGHELNYGTRRLHIMLGCPALVHWGARFLWHLFIYTVILILPIILISYAFDPSEIMSTVNFSLFFALILILGLMSWLSFVYIMSFACEDRLFPIISMCIIFGLVLGCLDALQKIFDKSLGGFVFKVIFYFSGSILPPHTMYCACLKAIYIACMNEFNARVNNRAPKLLFYEWKHESPFPDMVRLCFQFFYRMALVILTEEGMFHMQSRFYAKLRKPLLHQYYDLNAILEAQYVEKTIVKPHNNLEDLMLYHKVEKMFRPLYKPIRVLNSISFCVKKGECFGLLGKNGAGKTTIFKTIVAETGVSRGQIWTDGYFLKTPKGQYLTALSYCPQFVGVDLFLTGRQNLKLLLTLRGLSDYELQKEVDSWVRIIELKSLQYKPVSIYSGGFQRRIATVCALCTEATVTCLDEPTAGIDVTAKRRIWHAAKEALESHRAIIIASNNIEEMEALCGRVAILIGGEICALGTIPELRDQHAAGLSLWIKLVCMADDSEYQVMVELVKNRIISDFNCKLQEEHGTMLHYHIIETLPYSVLFRKMEEIKSNFFLFLEEYTVNETTLEEVFHWYAQSAR